MKKSVKNARRGEVKGTSKHLCKLMHTENNKKISQIRYFSFVFSNDYKIF